MCVCVEEDAVKGVVCVFMVKQLVNFIHKKFDIHMLIDIHQMFMWGDANSLETEFTADTCTTV